MKSFPVEITNCYDESKAERGGGGGVQEGFTEEVTFELRPG